MAMLGALDDNKASGCLLMLQFPFLVAAIAYSLTRMLVGGLVVAPIMGAMWRRRRLLADATAVELTRDPGALARALTQLRDNGATVPPGPWTHLFAIGPELGRERTMKTFERRRDEIWTGDGSFVERSKSAYSASVDLRRGMTSLDQADAADGPVVPARPRRRPAPVKASWPTSSRRWAGGWSDWPPWAPTSRPTRPRRSGPEPARSHNPRSRRSAG